MPLSPRLHSWVLDPCTNIPSGAKILTADYAEAARTRDEGPPCDLCWCLECTGRVGPMVRDYIAACWAMTRNAPGSHSVMNARSVSYSTTPAARHALRIVMML